mgnify:CR=1 FL=1
MEELSALGTVTRRSPVIASAAIGPARRRFANAVAYLGCAPADLTWRAGVDALSFGCVKNGGMVGEALLFFGPQAQARAAQAQRWRKRSGHLFSKGRYLAAQILAMIEDGLWLRNAQAANAAAQALAQGAGDRLLHPVQANELFVRLHADEAARLRAQGFDFYDWGEGAARLVTNWSQDAASVAPLAAALAALSRFAAGHAGHLHSAELNPVVVLPEGRGLVALDALIVPKA